MTRQPWEFSLSLDRCGRQPLFLQITRAIVDDICRGRLRPGDMLPGTRTLAASLKVNRVTVLTAYDELAAEGWITAHKSLGCSVSPQLPQNVAAPAAKGPFELTPAYRLPSAPVVRRSPEHLRGMLVFGASSPDARLLDVEPLARAYRRALRKTGRQLLGYATPEGHPRLRAAIATMLATCRGIPASAEHVFVTRGSQMALSLIARAVLGPGSAVAVEALGYRNAWQAFTAAGAELIPVPVDRGGLDISALARVVETRAISALYTTPHHQFPTTVTMSAARRLELLELARARGFAIIEDDYDHEFHYDGRPVLPLASLDRAGVVVYVGTFSRLLVPGIRLGFIAGPQALLERLGAIRETIDMQGDGVTEAAVGELFEDGEVQRHVRRVRGVYRARRDRLVELLRGTFGDELDFAIPAGGIALWVKASRVDVDRWAHAALGRQVAFQTGREFAFDGRPRPYARLGYASLTDDELGVAVGHLRVAYETVHGRSA
jgi:GntR family transcriptional regulator/MocR family aminotransferase